MWPLILFLKLNCLLESAPETPSSAFASRPACYSIITAANACKMDQLRRMMCNKFVAHKCMVAAAFIAYLRPISRCQPSLVDPAQAGHSGRPGYRHSIAHRHAQCHVYVHVASPVIYIAVLLSMDRIIACLNGSLQKVPPSKYMVYK